MQVQLIYINILLEIISKMILWQSPAAFYSENQLSKLLLLFYIDTVILTCS